MLEILSIIGIILAVAGVIIGSILVKKAYKKDRNGKIKTPMLIVGWSLITVLSLILTFVTVYAIWYYQSFVIVILLILVPAAVPAIIIATFGSGISFLVQGLRKDENGNINKKSFIGGIINLSISAIVTITAIVLLILLFNTLSHMDLGAM